MATDLPINSHANINGHANGANGTDSAKPSNTFSVKVGLARMLKGGVIMDVVNAEQVNISPSNTEASPPQECSTDIWSRLALQKKLVPPLLWR